MSADVDIFELGNTLETSSQISRQNAHFGTCDYSSFDSTVGHPLMLLIAYGLKDLFDYVLLDLELRM